ncbi:helix-turn-helix domain-containing protein [Vagococcus fluvialis]|uniref:helix-turn-helix domain-containing protein n=1 Tax=Vagococcus fluvialis TaxID=2738 RepID=UPI003B5C142A
MNISEEIKNQRVKNKWTQEQLADILNVSRSTVSSWEVGRNYPDLETIVAISDLFEISLDELLRGDKKMLEQITEDTNTRKTQSKKIKLLTVGIVALLISLLILVYGSLQSQEIVSPNQIESIKMTDSREVLITANLPFYRSVSGSAYYADNNDPSIMIIRIDTKVDLTMKNNESIELHPYTFQDLSQINIENKYGEIIKTYLIK